MIDEPLFMGILNAEKIRGKEIFSFQADEGWIKNGKVQFLDADLMQYEGCQYAPNDKPNFGLFIDSCPDRWGVCSCKEDRGCVPKIPLLKN